MSEKMPLILMVEDEQDVLKINARMMKRRGYEICETFREQCDHPVIFLTGKNELPDRIEGLDRGGDYYLTKPHNLDELSAVASGCWGDI